MPIRLYLVVFGLQQLAEQFLIGELLADIGCSIVFEDNLILVEARLERFEYESLTSRFFQFLACQIELYGSGRSRRIDLIIVDIRRSDEAVFLHEIRSFDFEIILLHHLDGREHGGHHNT